MNLEICNIDETYRLVWPENCRRLTTDSPALAVFTDFRRTMPLTVEPDTPAYAVEEVMTMAHTRFRLVVDPQSGFLGVVALEDLQHPDFRARLAAIYTGDTLTVAEVMRPRHALQALNYTELEDAKIGDIIESLKDCDHHHCLVVDKAAHQIRGMISASDMAGPLQLAADSTHAPGFDQLYLALST